MFRRLLGMFRPRGEPVPEPNDVEDDAAIDEGWLDVLPFVKTHTTPYFEAMTSLQGAVSARDFPKAQEAVHASLEHIPGFVDEEVKNYERFAIGSNRSYRSRQSLTLRRLWKPR